MLLIHHKYTHNLHLYYTGTTTPKGSIAILGLYPWDYLDNATINRLLGIIKDH